MDTPSLDDILSKLLVPDNKIIQEASKELQIAFRNPSIIPELCQILSNQPSDQIRQYAAIILRRKFIKQKRWNKLPSRITSGVKQTLLERLSIEQNKSVRKAITQVTATVAKHELKAQQWPELFNFMHNATHSQNVQEREVGMFVLSTVTSVAADELQPHLVSLLHLFSHTLRDADSLLVPYYTILSMTSLTHQVGSDEVKYFQSLLPDVLTVIKALVEDKEEQACEALEIFDAMVESEVAVLAPSLKLVTNFCLEIAKNDSLGDAVRVKAMSFLTTVAKVKKKALIKQKLVDVVLEVLFSILCATKDDDDDKELFEDSSNPHYYAAQVVEHPIISIYPIACNSVTPAECGDFINKSESVCANQAQTVIDTLALHLPPDKVIPPLMKMIENALASVNPQHRKAGYLAMAVAAEGCGDHIKNNYLPVLVECIYKGVTDSSPTVTGAALFALGQFAEHLQPDISKYHSQLLPMLFEAIGKVSETTKKDSTLVTKVFYAMEMFSEHLGKDLLQYLPTIMERLLAILRSGADNRIKELTVSAIGAIANAAESDMLPYFQAILEHLKVYLTTQYENGNSELQTQSLDTLGVLARTIGSESFMPIADECMQLGLGLLGQVDDPDLRRCTYGLFASLSTVLKQSIEQYLPAIWKFMLDSLQSTEGVTAVYDDNEAAFQLTDLTDEDAEDITEPSQDEEEEDNVQGMTVENAYLEEKEDTCNALGRLPCIPAHSPNLSWLFSDSDTPSFVPYMDSCFHEVLVLIDYPASNVRKAVTTCLGQFCTALYLVYEQTKSNDAQEGLLKALSICIPKFLEVIREDEDRLVVMATLETIERMLKKSAPAFTVDSKYVDTITSMVKDVLQLKVACQSISNDDDDGDDDNDEQAEFDGMLVEYAGDIIPAMASAVGGATFAPYFAGLLQFLLAKTRKNKTVAEKSFAVGTLADTVLAMDVACKPFVQVLLPVFNSMVWEEHHEVRSNAIFGMGVLLGCGGDASLPHFASSLQTLYGVFLKEKNPRAIDNICGALARMIMASPTTVPLNEVFPFMIECLPLKEDFAENKTVHESILTVASLDSNSVLPYLPKIISAIAQGLETTQLNEESKPIAVELLKSFRQKHQPEYEKAVNLLPPDLTAKLKSATM